MKFEKVKDLKIPKNYSLAKSGITQSLLSSFMQCPRRFLYQINGYIDSSMEEKCLFGKIIHSLIETMFNKRKFLSSKEIEKHIEKFTDDKITAIKAQAVFECYQIYWNKDLNNKKFISAEMKFEDMVFGVKRKGKIDLSFVDKHNGFWIVDHKSMGQINEQSLMMRLSFDFQTLFYTVAAEKILKKVVKGVLYNVIRKPQSNPHSGESAKDYYQRLLSTIKKDYEHYFKRYEIPYTEKDKNEFLVDLEIQFERLQEAIENNSFWKNSCSCFAPYQCGFMTACASGNMIGYKKSGLFKELK